MSCIVACGHRSKIVFFLENVQLKEKVHEKLLILNLCVCMQLTIHKAKPSIHMTIHLEIHTQALVQTSTQECIQAFIFLVAVEL